MAQRINLKDLYRTALRRMPESIDGTRPLPVPADCPLTLDELLPSAGLRLNASKGEFSLSATSRQNRGRLAERALREAAAVDAPAAMRVPMRAIIP